MNSDTISIQPDSQTSATAKTAWILPVVLRIASLGASYALWIVSGRLFTAKPADSILDSVLLAITILLCAFFLYVGTFAPDRVVICTWKILGKGILYILMLLV